MSTQELFQSPKSGLLAIAVVFLTWAGGPGIVPNRAEADDSTFFRTVVGVNALGWADESGADSVQQPSVTSRPYGRHFLRQFAVRNRALERDLARAEREVSAGRHREAIQTLQAVLDQPEDGFLLRESDGRMVSGRQTAEKLLEGLPPESLALYEQHSGILAAQLLSEAEDSRRWWKYGEVFRRFPLTRAGSRSRLRQAELWADRGDFDAAASLYQEMLASPIHRGRMDEPSLQRAMAVAERVNRSDFTAIVRAELMGRFPGNSLLKSVPTDHGPARLPLEEKRRHRGDPDWPMLQGSPDRNRVSLATSPFLEEAWSSTFTNGDKWDEFSDDLTKWEEGQLSDSKPRAVSNSAIAMGGLVVVRDLDGLRAIDLRTGSTAWTFRGTATYRRPSPSEGGPVQRGAGLVDRAEVYAENSVLGSLATDGQRVFAVDALDLQLSRGTVRETPFAVAPNASARMSRSANSLVALELENSAPGTSERRPLWRIGGLPTAGKPVDRPLIGHYFLGAPLPSEGRLFAMTENEGQLNVVSLDPATGRVVWIQGVGYVDRAIEHDSYRSLQGCLLAASEEILVCPTQMGVLAGVSAETGSLKWLYHCGDDPTDSRAAAFSFGGRAAHGHEGFPDLPHIRKDAVVYLPLLSRDIHCVDRKSGESRWTSERKDGQYIGAVTDELILVVGSRNCRAVSLKDGQERWSTRTGMPSGLGLNLGSRFLLPLEDGRVVTLDVATGRELGMSIPRARVAGGGEASSRLAIPGNLIPADEYLVSIGPFGVIAYRQSGRVLEETLTELRLHPDSIPLRLRQAELAMQIGEASNPASTLRQLLSENLPPAERSHAERLLREILYSDLALHPSAAGNESVLRDLDSLSRTPEDRGRFLVQKVEWQLKARNVSGVMRSAEELSGLHGAQPISFGGNPLHHVAAAGWVPSILERLHATTSGDALQKLTSDVQREQRAALRAGDEARLERFLAVYGRFPEADAIRLTLAESMAAAGKYERAELLLLECRRSRDPQSVAAAASALARLWDRLYLWHEAARLVTEFERESPAAAAEAGLTVREFAASLPEDSLTRSALRQLEAPEWPIRRVRISEDRWAAADNRIEEAFSGFRRKFQMPPENSFHLLDKGAGDNRALNESRSAVIDRHTGTITGYVSLPIRNSYPTYINQHRFNHAGHFFTMGTEGEAIGVSLLELDGEKPLWRTPLPRAAGRGDVARVGPAGPGFCTFQSRRSLYVLDPSDGRILWERGDLDANCGLISDPTAGLFGDSEVLVVFDGDATERGNYTVYRTSTGEELRTGRLDFDTSLQRRAIGRRFLFTTAGSPDRRMRLWDPLENRFIFDDATDDRPLPYPVGDDELAVLLTNGRLQVRNIETQDVRMNLQLRPDDLLNLSTFRVFRDPDHYFVNLQREMRTPFTQTFSHLLNDTFLHTVPVSGDLYAVDRRTGRVKWKRYLPQRSVIDLPHHRLPFLIGISKLRDRNSGTRQSLLVEVIDKATGATLGMKDNILSDRLVAFNYDQSSGRIDVQGLETIVRIEFGPAVQRFPSAE